VRLESELEKKVGRWCKRNGLMYIKFTPYGEKGWPDRIVIGHTGKHLWLELKREGKKPTKLQDHRMKEMRIRGVQAHWADNYEDALILIEECV